MNNLLVEQVDKKINLRVYIEIKKKLEKKNSLTQSRYSYSYMVGSEEEITLYRVHNTNVL